MASIIAVFFKNTLKVYNFKIHAGREVGSEARPRAPGEVITQLQPVGPQPERGRRR